jgi:hypothetical protein
MDLQIIRVRGSGFEILYDPTLKGGPEIRNTYAHCVYALDQAKATHGRHGIDQPTIDALRKELEARKEAYEHPRKS